MKRLRLPIAAIWVLGFVAAPAFASPRDESNSAEDDNSVPTVALEAVYPMMGHAVLVERVDDSTITGNLVGASPSGIVVRLPGGRGDVSIALADVRAVNLASANAGTSAPADDSSSSPSRVPSRAVLIGLVGSIVVVNLTSGATVQGRIESASDFGIVIRTSLAGKEVPIRRDEIQSMALASRTDASDVAVEKPVTRETPLRAHARVPDDPPETRRTAASKQRQVAYAEEEAALKEESDHAAGSVAWFASAAILGSCGALACITSWFVCGVPLFVAGLGLFLGAGVSALVGLLEGGAASAAEHKAAIAKRQGEMAY